jgi:hypothetical protein
MPVATIDEDRNARTREDEVGGAVEMRQRSSRNAVSQAEPVRCSPHGQLGARIALSVALHHEPHGRR